MEKQQNKSTSKKIKISDDKRLKIILTSLFIVSLLLGTLIYFVPNKLEWNKICKKDECKELVIFDSQIEEKLRNSESNKLNEKLTEAEKKELEKRQKEADELAKKQKEEKQNAEARKKEQENRINEENVESNQGDNPTQNHTETPSFNNQLNEQATSNSQSTEPPAAQSTPKPPAPKPEMCYQTYSEAYNVAINTLMTNENYNHFTIIASTNCIIYK